MSQICPQNVDGDFIIILDYERVLLICALEKKESITCFKENCKLLDSSRRHRGNLSVLGKLLEVGVTLHVLMCYCLYELL